MNAELGNKIEKIQVPYIDKDDISFSNLDKKIPEDVQKSSEKEESIDEPIAWRHSADSGFARAIYRNEIKNLNDNVKYLMNKLEDIFNI